MQDSARRTSSFSTARQAIGRTTCRVRLARLVAGLTWAAWTLGGCSLAAGQSGATYTRTAGGTGVTIGTAAGATVSIETWWDVAAGYRPARVTVTPTGPTTTDQTFTVEFLLGRRQWGDGQYDLRVARDIELPAGSGPVEATAALPQSPDSDSYAINVLVDGELQPGSSASWIETRNMPTDWEECLFSMLVVGDAPVDLSELTSLLPMDGYVGSQVVRRYGRARQVPYPPSRALVNVPQGLPGVISCGVGELPRRWIDYSGLDVVCLTLEQLGVLKEKNPAALRAVQQWTAAGGNLCVYGVGEDWNGVGRLEGLLGLPSAGDGGDAVSRG